MNSGLAVSSADQEAQKGRPIIVMGGMPTALAVFLERPQAEDQIGANDVKVVQPAEPGKREMLNVNEKF